MKTIKALPYLFLMVFTTLLFSSCEEEGSFTEPSEEPTASLHDELMAESELLLQSLQNTLKANSNTRTSTATAIDPIFFDLNLTPERGELEGETTTLPVALTSVRRVNSNNFIYTGTITAENGVEGDIDVQYRPRNSNSLTISFIFDAILPDGSQGESAVIFGESTEFFLSNGFALAPGASGPFETITFDRGFISFTSDNPALDGSADVTFVPSDGTEGEPEQPFVPFVTADSTIEYSLRINLIEGPRFAGVFTINTARELFDGSVRVQGTIAYADGKRGDVNYFVIPETREITVSQITRFTQTDAGAVDVETYILGDDFRLVTPTVGFGDLLAGDAFDEETFGDRVGTILLELSDSI